MIFHHSHKKQFAGHLLNSLLVYIKFSTIPTGFTRYHQGKNSVYEITSLSELVGFCEDLINRSVPAVSGIVSDKTSPSLFVASWGCVTASLAQSASAFHAFT
jgi:hypothetical protein